ncbi:MAG: sulfite exporter TauE/SafE family protein [Chloroflexi bacterium]|nr:MAG: sulfite exporter TauE/SafE family protein [Chloroflexota bacterium]
MTIIQMLILFIAAILGGTLNAVAGGGSFIGFPSLIFTGIHPIEANATNAIALWPGSVASVGAYRRELAQQPRDLLFLLVGTSLIGGILGAILLLKTPKEIFIHLVPYLLLVATLLFTFSGPITSKLRQRSAEKASRMTIPALVGVSVAQLIISIYGGYFGGGIGILMLATLAMMGMENIHEMNAMKTVLTSCINGVAVVTFIIAGAVVWQPAILMIVGAIIGGYAGAYYARKIEQKWIRSFVIVMGFSLSVYFFFFR